MSSTPAENEAAIGLFCDLLKFKTVSFEGPSSGAYRECAAWLVETLGGNMGLKTQVNLCVLVVVRFGEGIQFCMERESSIHRVWVGWGLGGCSRPWHCTPPPPRRSSCTLNPNNTSNTYTRHR